MFQNRQPTCIRTFKVTQNMSLDLWNFIWRSTVSLSSISIYIYIYIYIHIYLYILCTVIYIIYLLGKNDLNLQIHNRTKKIYIYTKLKDKIYSSFFNPFLACLNSSYFHCLLPRFKGSHQELSKYIKRLQRTFGKEKF